MKRCKSLVRSFSYIVSSFRHPNLLLLTAASPFAIRPPCCSPRLQLRPHRTRGHNTIYSHRCFELEIQRGWAQSNREIGSPHGGREYCPRQKKCKCTGITECIVPCNTRFGMYFDSVIFRPCSKTKILNYCGEVGLMSTSSSKTVLPS